MKKKLLLKLTTVMSLLLLSACSSQPSDDITKNIAMQYSQKMFKVSDIKIIKSYEKDGKVVMILKINKAVCEIPMIEIENNWTGAGFSCQGTPYNIKDLIQKYSLKTLEAKPLEDEPSASKKSTYTNITYPLDKFTVNIKSDQGRRYLQITLSLELNNNELTHELNAKSHVIRDRIIRILSSKSLEKISSKKGKKQLSNQIKTTMNAMLRDGNIQNVNIIKFSIL